MVSSSSSIQKYHPKAIHTTIVISAKGHTTRSFVAYLRAAGGFLDYLIITPKFLIIICNIPLILGII